MDRKLLRKLDFALLALVGILLIFGLVMVYSATQSGVHHDPGSFSSPSAKCDGA